MREEVFLFGETPSLCNLACVVREKLGWTEKGVDLCLEGPIGAGSCNVTCMKIIAPIGNKKEWQAYVQIVINSEVRALDLVVRKAWSNPMLHSLDLGVNSLQGTNGRQWTGPFYESSYRTVTNKHP